MGRGKPDSCAHASTAKSESFFQNVILIKSHVSREKNVCAIMNRALYCTNVSTLRSRLGPAPPREAIPWRQQNGWALPLLPRPCPVNNNNNTNGNNYADWKWETMAWPSLSGVTADQKQLSVISGLRLTEILSREDDKHLCGPYARWGVPLCLRSHAEYVPVMPWTASIIGATRTQYTCAAYMINNGV